MITTLIEVVAPEVSPVRPVISQRCRACGGDGWIETGMQAGTNIGIGQRCANCAGSGQVYVEVAQ